MSNTCELCDISFTRRGSLKLHVLRRHSEKESQSQEISTQGDRSFSCNFCSSIFESRQNLVDHINSNHSESLVFQKRSAINEKICFFRKDLTTEKGTLADFCGSKKVLTEIYNLIISEFAKKSVFRISIVITCNYEIPDFTEENSGKSSDNDTFSLRSRGLVVNEFEGEKSCCEEVHGSDGSDEQREVNRGRELPRESACREAEGRGESARDGDERIHGFEGDGWTGREEEGYLRSEQGGD